MSLKIVKTVDRELTEKEVESIEKFRSYTNGASFACLRERIMIIPANEPCKDVEMLKAETRRKMLEALSRTPDFCVYDMPDGHSVLLIEPGLFGISANTRDVSDAGDCLILHGECLGACEAGQIIAIAYDE